MSNFAWVIHEKKLYWVSDESLDTRCLSLVQLLIFNIFESHHDLSFFILRNCIYTTVPENPYDQASVKLAAKKVRYGQDKGALEDALSTFENKIQLNFNLNSSVDFQNSKMNIEPSFLESEMEVLKFIRKLEEKIPRGPVLHDYNRQIVAILVNERNEVLFANSNYNYRNKVLHAEINLVGTYLEKRNLMIPAGSKIFVSLKPCRMCANVLHKSCEPGVQIFYFKNDPGRLAQGSLIESRLVALG